MKWFHVLHTGLTGIFITLLAGGCANKGDVAPAAKANIVDEIPEV